MHNYERTRLFINGEWVPSAGTQVVDVVDPSTEEVFGTVPGGTAADVDAAVAAARAAFDPLITVGDRRERLAAVIAAMLEEGIDLRDEEPKAVSPDLLWQVDKVITLGVDLRPLSGGVRFDDWDLPESGGLQLAELRPIRDAIKGRVLTLLAEFNAPAAA